MGTHNAERKLWGLALILAPALFATSTFFWVQANGRIEYDAIGGTIIAIATVFWIPAFVGLFDLVKDRMPRYAAWGLLVAIYGCIGETGIMYVTSITNPLVVTLANRRAQSPAPYVGAPAPMETLQGVPLWKPPYGRITAIDLNTGDHQWTVPMGDLDHPRLKPLGLPPVGRPTRGHTLLTKTLLIVGQEGTTQRAEGGSAAVPAFGIHDPTLRGYDKATGKLVGEVALPRDATAAPMTYMLKGRQYIVVATGGANLSPELIALRLP